MGMKSNEGTGVGRGCLALVSMQNINAKQQQYLMAWRVPLQKVFITTIGDELDAISVMAL